MDQATTLSSNKSTLDNNSEFSETCPVCENSGVFVDGRYCPLCDGFGHEDCLQMSNNPAVKHVGRILIRRLIRTSTLSDDEKQIIQFFLESSQNSKISKKQKQKQKRRLRLEADVSSGLTAPESTNVPVSYYERPKSR